ncbi:HNH endonuclease [uncultured Desulfuromusa sp.]|uniref:HNH endonuclease signature motif containing protein n=1 Tax=uncultured Desulfuromusa sp. TaxID=219183 RepID=UPI002AA5F7F0|nr:HNH endonuclease [uncultured Desulfuromusa sp.]
MITFWEQHHGPVPEGMVISFIDGNKLNCVVKNLELLTMKQNAILNRLGIRYVPDEMRTASRALAELASKTRERAKDLRP